MRPRSWMAGMTDYTSVPLSDILDQLSDWRFILVSDIDSLEVKKSKVREANSFLENPQEVLRYIDYFIDLLQRYKGDIERLLKELRDGVSDRHVEIVMQIAQSLDIEETRCIRFKRNEIQKKLRYEKMRPLLDEIYRDSRQALIDLKDLSNIAPRLRTYIDVKATKPVLELNPNFHGIGVNLNAMWPKIKGWCSDLKKFFKS